MSNSTSELFKSASKGRGGTYINSSSAERLEALPMLSCVSVGDTLPRAPECSWGL